MSWKTTTDTSIFSKDKWFDFLFTDNAMIVYISRGLLSSLAEARDVMETIASMNGRLKNRVIINTYAVIDGKS